MWTWNDDTPANVPAGARISAGKLGNVARSLPNAAESSVNRSPTNCMPSPESPANRITTRSSVSAPWVGVASKVTVDHQLSRNSGRSGRCLHRLQLVPQYIRPPADPVLGALVISAPLGIERLEE